MAKTNAKLCSRLEHLEARRTPKQTVCLVFVWRWIPKDRRENLAPGERIVQDHYRQCGQLINARQRITTDPDDHGRRCEPEGYLEDVIQELHKNCWYRERGGSCLTCTGTPVANT